VPQSGNGGQPGGHEHDAVAPLGNASGESLHLVGYGVTVLYTQSLLKVTWENGTEMTMRSPGRGVTAEVHHIRLVVDIVTLTLKAQIAVPDPGLSRVDIVLAFPGSLEEDVQRLAGRVNAGREDSGSLTPEQRAPRTAEPAHGARAHDQQPPAGPARTGYPAQPQPVGLPAVTFQADLDAWAESPDWIGLYPSRETTRLIVTGRPLRQSHEAGSPPSA
jgi:hypothetical protein